VLKLRTVISPDYEEQANLSPSLFVLRAEMYSPPSKHTRSLTSSIEFPSLILKQLISLPLLKHLAANK